MAGRIAEIKEVLTKSLHDRSKPWAAAFDIIEAKTGVDRLYIFIGSIALIGLWLVFGYAAQLVCNCVGVLYPAYVSIHAIESKNKDDDTKWLTYWVVFALFTIVEFFSDLIVGWFPLYWLVKCVFLIWLMIPTELNGSLILYRKVIRPYFLKHHTDVDNILAKAKETANKAFDKHE